VLIVIIKQQRPEMAMQLSLAFSAFVLMLVLGKIAGVIEVLKELTQRANVNQFYLTTVLKIIGIAYIAEFGAQVCRDAGESAVASKLEFSAKVLIVVLAVPILVAIIESLLRLTG
ncbi:MAG: stage III sporulation protein AD, partial [Syntrophomonadaceae bacterium]|nr:stage III sporulation protein AD [Syntrophomonadaceae bacterium]